MALPRLYAILDVDAVLARGLQPPDVAAAWLDAGVRLMQLRAKQLSLGPFAALAAALADRAREHDALLIVNDRADVAVLAGAAGVHVGQDDLRPAEVRQTVGAAPLVGLSTHTVDQVASAVAEPIDYLAVGPVFQTTTKLSRWDVVGLALVGTAARLAGRLPVVAIGGITVASAAAVLEAGASSVAVISGLLEDDPAASARAFLGATAAARI